ncbi:hypothetical protein [Winogradskyella sp.]|uniref:hypothetical protein n=1 Tax=Winogradskyella sp. TaxID=1883156 RepID=UPI0026164B96|nr:hypothetical protein [Winogradskyella sp.]
MKKYVYQFLMFMVIFTSCNIENDNTLNFYLEVVPIESVDVPEEFILGQIHEISVTYTRPNSCYEFNDFIYSVQNNVRSVAVANTVYTNIECMSLSEDVTVSFDFVVSSLETHVFQFYQGTNDDGIDQYHIVEVPVVEGD